MEVVLEMSVAVEDEGRALLCGRRILIFVYVCTLVEIEVVVVGIIA